VWFTEIEAELKAALADLLERVEEEVGEGEDSVVGLLDRLERKMCEILAQAK
jgi:hypothetical protein